MKLHVYYESDSGTNLWRKFPNTVVGNIQAEKARKMLAAKGHVASIKRK